jgi:hypothetical protein
VGNLKGIGVKFSSYRIVVMEKGREESLSDYRETKEKEVMREEREY